MYLTLNNSTLGPLNNKGGVVSIISTILIISSIIIELINAKPTQLIASDSASDWNRAMDYYKRLHVEYSCNVPQARIIPVQQIHPDPGVAYVTTCVILHRCAADTGCCPETDVCVAQQQETVDIPVITHDARTPYRILQFSNHTQCHCIQKHKLLQLQPD